MEKNRPKGENHYMKHARKWLACLLAGGLALAGLGLVAEQRKEPQKIHKVPENTVKKAVCGRKAG